MLSTQRLLNVSGQIVTNRGLLLIIIIIIIIIKVMSYGLIFGEIQLILSAYLNYRRELLE